MRRRPPKAFTIVELVAAITVMSIVAGVVMPLIVSSTDAYSVTRTARDETDRTLYALERVQRLIRETPWRVDDSGIGFVAADAGSFTIESGERVRVLNDRLVVRDASGAEHDLCTGVSSFVVTYYDASGSEMGVLDAAQVHRVGVTLTSGSTTLSTYAMPRAWVGRDTP